MLPFDPITVAVLAAVAALGAFVVVGVCSPRYRVAATRVAVALAIVPVVLFVLWIFAVVMFLSVAHF